MRITIMLCPECCLQEMTVVDAGTGDPCWVCPACRFAMDYERADDVFDGKDDGVYIEESDR